MQHGRWTSPDAGAESFGHFAERWLAERDLKPRTRAHYQSILNVHLLPTFAAVRLDAITTPNVRSWHRKLDTGPTMKAHAYALLRTVLGTAVADECLTRNPCVLRGAGSAKRAGRTEPATLPVLDAITADMPERLSPMVLLAACCALRFGELAELRRADLDLDPDGPVVDVSRAVVSVKAARSAPPRATPVPGGSRSRRTCCPSWRLTYRSMSDPSLMRCCSRRRWRSPRDPHALRRVLPYAGGGGTR